MKRVVVMIILAIISMGAYAQTSRGMSSLGLNVGYGFDHTGNAYFGADYRYCILDDVRISPSISYYVKNDGVSACALDFNAHYVVKLNESFGFYPLAGLNLSFWDVVGYNATRFGANIGLGGEVYATPQLSVGLELKYLIIKDFDRPMLGIRIGYNF